MATKRKAAPKTDATVVRITASDTKTPKPKTKKTTKKAEVLAQPAAEPSAPAVKKRTKLKVKAANPLAAMSRYFVGAWKELGQVRWPDRKATWSMTGALLGFTAFFVVLILLLDAGFKYLFQLILG